MRIPMNSSSSASLSDKPAPFAAFNMRDDSPMSIPSPSPNTQQFRRPPQSEQDELRKLGKASSNPPKRSRIITSDDETSPANSKPMGLLAATANTNNATSTQSGWMKARDPINVSADQRNKNIFMAKMQRTALKTIPKLKSTLLQQTLNLVDDDDGDADTSADEAEQGGTLWGDMSKAMSALHQNRSTMVKSSREARLQDRQSKHAPSILH